MMRTTALIPFLIAALAAGCVEENATPAGLRAATPMGGAQVVFDLDARPLPQIPFPNDLATRIDPTSPTGLRVNISTMAVTDLEAGVREHANQLDGFSNYGAMWVQFTAPLDVQNILDRHRQLVPDFKDDAIYLVNIDPRSPSYGEFHLLDLGTGVFPSTMKTPTKYFDFDPRSHGTNLLFESVQEVDTNGNGVLDPMEDTDDDGVWDTPNTKFVGADPLGPNQMLDFYERETNTLIIRSTETLRPATRYAVVLTKALVDENSVPIDSPFDFINHSRQTEDLAPLRDILPRAFPDRFDASLEGVRFAWSFTTQTTTYELEQIRAGMYGHGNLGWLARQFPAEMKLLHAMQSDGATENVLIAPVRQLIDVLLQIFASGEDAETVAALLAAGREVEYVVGGSFETPFFLIDKDGLHGTPEERAKNKNTYDDDEIFEIDYNTGAAIVGSDEVTWWCMVPKEKPGRAPPYPVVIYGHGYGSSRLEGIGFASQMAKFGLVTCSMDNVGHGLPVQRFLKEDNILLDPVPLLENIGLGNMVNALDHGRHRDVTNDGLLDPGGDYWVADVFHTRDNVRQTTIDYMQFIRIMRSWDGTKRWPDRVDTDDVYIKAAGDLVAGWDTNGDGVSEIAGDFNGDGVVDFGGPQPYYAWGQSLGGIQSAVLVAIEPTLRAAAPTAGSAGLGDVAIRSTQGGVPEAVMLPIFGPIVLGRPVDQYNADTDAYEWSGKSNLEFLVSNAFDEAYLPFATVELEHGDQIVYRNLKREERSDLIEPGTEQGVATVRNGSFRLGLAGDAQSGDQRRHALGFDAEQDIEELRRRLDAPQPGIRQEVYLRRGLKDLHSTDVISSLDVAWGENEAPAGVRPTEHSIVWEGLLRAPTDGAYTIRAESVGRTQVFFEGRRRINVTNTQGSWRLSLSPDKPVHVRVEYERQGATGSSKLFWTTAGLAEQVIPASAWKTHDVLSDAEREEMDRHQIDNARDFGDSLLIEIYDADGNLKQTIDKFEKDVYFQNVYYPAGSPLANLREGYGLARQTPAFRRFLAIAQLVLDKADPANFARNYFQEPLQFPYEEDPMFRSGMSNVLVVPTSGDSAVPINTGISIARLSGIVDARKMDPRYGMTTNQYIIENFVYEGIHWLDRHPGYPGALFDIDDLDNGRFTSSAWPERGTDANPDAAKPVRATIQTSRGVSAMRIPYTRVDGEHGFGLPIPSLSYDIHSFMANQIGYYFANGGEVLSDDPCMERLNMAGCSFFNNEDWQRPDVQ